MADEDIEHCGQGELERCEVMHTSSSSAVSLTEIISSPSGKPKNGVVGIPCSLLHSLFAGVYQTNQPFSMAHQKLG
jgi:hypothetical protein